MARMICCIKGTSTCCNVQRHWETVLERYGKDFREEGRHSYDYKLNSGRIKE